MKPSDVIKRYGWSLGYIEVIGKCCDISDKCGYNKCLCDDHFSCGNKNCDSDEIYSLSYHEEPQLNEEIVGVGILASIYISDVDNDKAIDQIHDEIVARGECYSKGIRHPLYNWGCLETWNCSQPISESELIEILERLEL